MKYLCLTKEKYQINNFIYVPLRKEDMVSIKNWRNDQIDILRQGILLTDQDQISYYQNIILSSFEQKKPSLILFSILKNNQCIGYGGLTNVDWISKKAEISFLIDTSYSNDKIIYEECFNNFLEFIKIIVFNEIDFNRIFAETYDIRPHHIEILEKNGFKKEGILKENVVISNKFVDSKIHGFLKKDYVSA